jgi:hypothetical protein
MNLFTTTNGGVWCCFDCFRRKQKSHKKNETKLRKVEYLELDEHSEPEEKDNLILSEVKFVNNMENKKVYKKHKISKENRLTFAERVKKRFAGGIGDLETDCIKLQIMVQKERIKLEKEKKRQNILKSTAKLQNILRNNSEKL